jgi:hypothetical protein
MRARVTIACAFFSTSGAVLAAVTSIGACGRIIDFPSPGPAQLSVYVSEGGQKRLVRTVRVRTVADVTTLVNLNYQMSEY